MTIAGQILYEDNHLIALNKLPGQIVQGDKTGDVCLADEVKAFLKERDAKPGNVFLGVVHRLDRPVSGVVLFARTSKALARLNALFADHETITHKNVRYAFELTLTPHRVSSLLQRLVREGRLIRIGDGCQTRYRPAPGHFGR